MTYRLNPTQFVENGAAILAERARLARHSAHVFELLQRARCGPSEPCPLDRAA